MGGINRDSSFLFFSFTFFFSFSLRDRWDQFAIGIDYWSPALISLTFRASF